MVKVCLWLLCCRHEAEIAALKQHHAAEVARLSAARDEHSSRHQSELEGFQQRVELMWVEMQRATRHNSKMRKEAQQAENKCATMVRARFRVSFEVFLPEAVQLQNNFFLILSLRCILVLY